MNGDDRLGPVGLTKSNPQIAVCLAAYNGLSWIDEQLNSILNQSGVEVSVFISVDLSDDGTFEYVQNRAMNDERIRILDYGCRFGGAARNFYRLIRDVPLENFEYFCFADQDDIWLPEKLISAVDLVSREDADAYSSNVVAFWPSGSRKVVDKSQPQRKWDYLFEAAGPGCTYVFRRELWLALRTFLMANWEAVQGLILHDWFCYAFARKNMYTWVIDCNSHMLYRQHDRNQVGVNRGLMAFKIRLLMFINNQWLSQSKQLFDILEMESTPFFRPGVVPNRMRLFKLALLARNCRRRFRDQLFFLIFCLLLSVLGWKVHGAQ